MPREELLSDVLSEFARTMVTDFPIQRILDRLVERIVDVLPITAAGVTLIAPGADPRYIAASDASALRFEMLQTELGEGPCLLAYTSGEAVAVGDLRSEHRFPSFARRALESGLGAVFTFPLRSESERLGALDLYRDKPGPLDADTMAAAQTLADVAAAYLRNAQDRADLSEASERSRYNSLHDPLTGLPNRVLLVELLNFAVLRARRSGKIAAVVFLDLDRFKSVNDTYGHRAGDELLIAVAARLSQALRPSDALARLSGDEFVIVCEELDSPSQVPVIAARIAAALSAPFELPGGQVKITASAGIAVAHHGDATPEELIHRADRSMYQAKAQGGGRVVDWRGERTPGQHTSVEHDLRTAEANGELRVEYQPIVDTATGRITGFEALVRWDHPTSGPIPPTVLVPLAEHTGLIANIGLWVLGRACADQRHWQRAHGTGDLELAVNVSAHQLMSPGFAASVEAVLQAPGDETDPSLLTLEVTESVLIHDAARALVVLNDLKHLGVKIALDDFGTGYSSISYLDQFPVDIIKIDQTFIARLGQGDASRAIVASVVDLTHVLGMTVVAEGVETAEQRELVSQLGCDSSQGFYFARPMSADDLDVLIEHPDAAGAVLLPVLAGLPAA